GRWTGYGSPGPQRRAGRIALQRLELIGPIQSAIRPGEILRTDLRRQSLLDRQRIRQWRRRKKCDGRDGVMRRAEPVDAAGALRQARPTPRPAVVHGPAGLLEVQPLAPAGRPVYG